jgi:hypothetical protein
MGGWFGVVQENMKKKQRPMTAYFFCMLIKVGTKRKYPLKALFLILGHVGFN